MKTLKEALFNKKTLTYIGYDSFISKRVSELLDYIIDKGITDYIILSIKNPKFVFMDKIILCPDVEHIKKLIKFVEKYKNHNVFVSETTKDILINSIKRVKEVIKCQNCFIITKTTYPTGGTFLSEGIYKESHQGKNPYYEDCIIQDISVLPEINNVTLLL